MNDDNRACAEVCEAHGFLRQASLFRSLAQGGFPVYVVAWTELGFDRKEGPIQGGQPWLIFLERWEAEEEAYRLNFEAYRQIQTTDDCCLHFGSDFEINRFSDLSEEEFCQAISQILGEEFSLEIDLSNPASLFPASATDDQIGQIMDICLMRFYYVTEVELSTGADHG
jgi:hypothetical protein